MAALQTVPAEDAIARQAAEWIVQLSTDDPRERAAAESGFAAWKASDPRHGEAAARMEAMLGQIGGLDAAARGAARRTLARSFPVRRWPTAAVHLVWATFFILGGLLPYLFFADPGTPAVWVSDLRTGRGEWRTSTLADGSRLELAAQSAVDVNFSGERRHVELLRGEILVDVAPDAGRPFVVSTGHGQIRALGTRFRVTHQGDSTLLTMLESKVAVDAAGEVAGTPPRIVPAGQRVRITAAGIDDLPGIDPRSDEQAWHKHLFVAQGVSLAQVLDEIQKYQPGHIAFDRQVMRRIRISAVLPLDDSDAALQLLANNFPQLRLRRYGPYWLRADWQGEEK